MPETDETEMDEILSVRGVDSPVNKEPQTVFGDKARFKQVIANLCLNAITHTP
jgi:signal transduction histidine kinase